MAGRLARSTKIQRHCCRKARIVSEREYRVVSTSSRTAAVEPVVLSLRENDDGALTRRVLLPTVVVNTGEPDASVHVTIAHQRRARAGAQWDEPSQFSLARLRAGEEIRLDLHASEVLRLYRHLRDLYGIAQRGIPASEDHLTVVDADEVALIRGSTREIVSKLLGAHGDGIFEVIGEIDPDLLTAAVLTRQHRSRMAALTDFESHLDGGWTEDDWQHFFEANEWIFGHGLAYQFLTTLQSQPDYGGQSYVGRGGQRGDFLMSTEANARFSVLVEIKLPTVDLVQDATYRNGAHKFGVELAGGVSQIQTNCRTWAEEAARTDANREALAERGVDVVLPKGIVLIGDTRHLDTFSKRRTFELFRRHLTNPEVLTYDELLARARVLVTGGNGSHEEQTKSPAGNEDEMAFEDAPF